MASTDGTLKDPGPPSTHDATKWILGALGAVQEDTTPTAELDTEEKEKKEDEEETPKAINDKVRKIDTRLTTVEIKISKTKKPIKESSSSSDDDDDDDDDDTTPVQRVNSAAAIFVQPDEPSSPDSSFLNILSVM